jgi:hypothetical protein
MAGVKVTDLTTLGTADPTDVMYIVDTSTNTSKQIEVGNVVNLQTAYDNGSTINGADVVIESTGLGFGIGEGALSGATGTLNIAIGDKALKNSTGDNSVCLGTTAGQASTGNACIFLGQESGNSNTGDDVIGLGYSAGSNNSLNGMFVIAQTHMPSYADATAAATAITVALGAHSGDYYLYHDQSDDTIKAIIPV